MVVITLSRLERSTFNQFGGTCKSEITARSQVRREKKSIDSTQDEADGSAIQAILGLKSFMCPSGINDFPMTNSSHIKEGLSALAKYKRPLLVHAEIQLDSESNSETEDSDDDPRSYSTYLKTRPPSMEEAAIRELLTVTKDTRTGASSEGAHLHIH